jgi:hypothetical protein
MTHESDLAACWRRLNDALVEAGEPQLVSSKPRDSYKSSFSCEDTLILKLFGVEQTAPRDPNEAFDQILGEA